MSNSIPFTKLQPPRAVPDEIRRPRLDRQLDEIRHRPLALVSGPAGYGKSTLVAHWAGDTGLPVAWLSLDPEDSSLSAFGRGLVAAIRLVSPVSLDPLSRLLASDDPPTGPMLARAFIDALGEEELVLVLEDYHQVHGTEVHDFVSEILRYPPPGFHAVIMTRQDPPLPITRLRAAGQLVEIRMQQLRFDEEETGEFLQRVLPEAAGAPDVPRLLRLTEGWPAAIRLALLARGGSPGLPGEGAPTGGAHEYVHDYLASEVLAGQTPDFRRALLLVSLLDRFSAPLCERVLQNESGGETFLEEARRQGLFLVGLDGAGTWFRFHHLFRDLLREEAERILGAAERTEALRCAARWFEEQDRIEDALRLTLAAGDHGGIPRLFAQHGQDLMNREEWSRLDDLLSALPRDIADTDLGCLVQQVWLLENRYRYTEMYRILDRIEERIASAELPPVPPALRGEIRVLQAGRHYLAGRAEEAIALAREGLEDLPEEARSQQGYARVVEALGHQQAGRPDEARATALRAYQADPRQGTTYQSRALIALAFIHWLEGDAGQTRRVGEELLALGDSRNLPESRDFAHYFLGLAHLDGLRFDLARRHLAPLAGNPHWFNSFNTAHAACALASAHLAEGRAEEARSVAEALLAQALNRRNPDLLALAEACAAGVGLGTEQGDQAIAWARSHTPHLSGVRLRFLVPEVVQARILLASGQPEDRERAAGIAGELDAAFAATHSHRHRLDVVLLRAVLAAGEGRREEAERHLDTAIRLAQPGGLLFPFLAVGRDLAPAIQTLAREQGTPFLGTILQALRSRGVVEPGHVPGAAEDLTSREVEILGLLQERLSDKEIAERLYIAPGTVKKHLGNIYAKLDVHDRREAAAKARDLKFI